MSHASVKTLIEGEYCFYVTGYACIYEIAFSQISQRWEVARFDFTSYIFRGEAR